MSCAIEMSLIVVAHIFIVFMFHLIHKSNEILSVDKLIISCLSIGLFLQFNLIISILDSIAIFKILVFISSLVILTEHFLAVVLLFLVGTFYVLSSQDLISLYLGIELQSVSLCILSCLGKNSALSAEISLKYFVIGALGSILFLFGCALVYGVTGTVSFQELPILFTGMEEQPLATFAAFGNLLLSASILLKLDAVPFHVGSPDINEGALSIATAFFSIVAKIGLVVVLARFFVEVLYGSHFLLYCWVVAGLSCGIGSIYLGSIAALKQRRLSISTVFFSIVAEVGFVIVLVRFFVEVFYIASFLTLCVGLFYSIKRFCLGLIADFMKRLLAEAKSDVVTETKSDNIAEAKSDDVTVEEAVSDDGKYHYLYRSPKRYRYKYPYRYPKGGVKNNRLSGPELTNNESTKK